MSRSFNGTTDYLEYGGAVVGVVPITLACWFYTDGGVPASSVLMAIGESAGVTRVQLWVDTAFKVNTNTTDTGSTTGTATSLNAARLNGWQHASAVIAASNDRRAFVNGGGKGTNATNITLGTPTATTIGTRYGAGVHGSFFRGWIADAAVWNVALTDDEVMLLGRGYSPRLVRPGSLVSYWPLVGQSSPAEIDVKGRFDATVNGAKPAIYNHPLLVPRSRRHRALDLVRLKRGTAALTGVFSTGALGTVIPVLPPQQPGAIVFTRQIG